MTFTYFLGANSCRGFSSLYGGFPPADGVILHIIKGGPGTGKSSFMKRLAREAQSRGLHTEQVLCSGDPDSLDGLFIPELGEAWVDGTSPHIAEPSVFGADADYVNLGRFCRTPLEPCDAERARDLSREYKALYSRAYGCLAAVESLRSAEPTAVFSEAAMAVIRRRVRGTLNRELSGKCRGDGRERHVFLSALSCRGGLRLGERAQELCGLIYELDDGLGGAPEVLRTVRQEALALGAELICCHEPLEPERLEAVLLPEASLGFAAGDWGLSRSRHMRIDALIPAETARELRRERRSYAALETSAVDTATELLSRAKKLHDLLELVYRPYMDYAALDEYTDSVSARLFG